MINLDQNHMPKIFRLEILLRKKICAGIVGLNHAS